MGLLYLYIFEKYYDEWKTYVKLGGGGRNEYRNFLWKNKHKTKGQMDNDKKVFLQKKVVTPRTGFIC
jgi:hypothetical protein